MLPGLAMADDDDIDDKTILGRYEQVYIKELDTVLPAKLDTGAESASLSAKNIEEYEEDDEQIIQFDLALSDDTRDKLDLDEDDLTEIKVPSSGHVHIKRRAESDDDEKETSKRPVTELTLCIGDRKAETKVNLTNREHFEYPLLIGAKGLKEFKALVDASQDDDISHIDDDDKDKAVKQCDP